MDDEEKTEEKKKLRYHRALNALSARATGQVDEKLEEAGIDPNEIDDDEREGLAEML